MFAVDPIAHLADDHVTRTIRVAAALAAVRARERAVRDALESKGG